ncbi:MAG: RNase H family protein [Propionibacteriaceae bacterium]
MITASADGSSLSNPGPAGWAWYVDETCWAAGGWKHGTNNMGELMAVLNLLQQTAHINEPLHILCDSQYAINACTTWMPGWKRKGWKKSDGKPILNLELVQELDRALTRRQVSFEWVKGHAGHPLNEAADTRARAAATAYRDGTMVPEGPGFTGSPVGSVSMEVGPSTREEEPDLFSVPVDLDTFVIRLDAPDDQSLPHTAIHEHIQFLSQLDRSGLLVLAGPIIDAAEPYGLVVIRAESLAGARAIAARDPFVAQGLRTADVGRWQLATKDNGYEF